MAPRADGQRASKMVWKGRWESGDSGVTAPQEDKHRRGGPACPLLGADPREPRAGTGADVHTLKRTVACPREQTATSGWRRHTRPRRTTECPSASKRKEVLTPAAAWVGPEDTAPGETSRSEKDKSCRTSQEVPGGVTSTETGRGRWGRGWGRGRERV